MIHQSLIETAIAILPREINSMAECIAHSDNEHRFIEALSFSSKESIVSMLDYMQKEHWLEFPIWARVLSFRIACLLDPTDAAIRRRAAIDLLSFGPDWDEHAAALQAEADRLTAAQ